MTKKLIGYAGVDSGQLIIVDPCYLAEWKDGEADDKGSHYGKACEATLSRIGGGEVLVAGVAGMGVAISTGGDGAFPVYAHYQEDGRISKIEISGFW
jgi:hypothetical protein